MLNFTLTVDPSSADVALEVLRHIENAIEAMKRGASKVAEKLERSAQPAPVPAPVAETIEAPETEVEEAPAPKKQAAKKTAPKPAAKKPAPEPEPEIGALSDLDDDELLEKVRALAVTMRDKLGVKALVDLMTSFEKRQLSELDRDERIEFVTAGELQLSDA